MKFVDLVRKTFQRKDMDIALCGIPDGRVSLDRKAPGLGCSKFQRPSNDAEPPLPTYGPGALRAMMLALFGYNCYRCQQASFCAFGIQQGI